MFLMVVLLRHTWLAMSHHGICCTVFFIQWMNIIEAYQTVDTSSRTFSYSQSSPGICWWIWHFEDCCCNQHFVQKAQNFCEHKGYSQLYIHLLFIIHITVVIDMSSQLLQFNSESQIPALLSPYQYALAFHTICTLCLHIPMCLQ